MAYETSTLNKVDRAASRIETDIETLKSLTNRVETCIERVIKHARSLGYYESTPTTGAAPTPVVTTMADALRALDTAVDHCSGALNVFD